VKQCVWRTTYETHASEAQIGHLENPFGEFGDGAPQPRRYAGLFYLVMSDMREDVRKQERLKETVKLAQERSDLEDASLVLRDSPSLYALIGNLQGKRDILPTEDASSVRSSMQTATTTSPLALPLAQIAASSVVSNKAYIYLDGTMSVEALHTSYTSDHVIESPDCLISLSDHLSSTSDNVGNSTTDLSAPLSDLVPPGMPTTTLIDKQKRTLTTDDSVLTLVVECQETAASAVMMSSSTAVAKKQPTVVPPPIPPRRSKPLPPLPQLASPTVFRSPAVALDASTASKSSVSVATFDVVAIQTPCVGDNTMTRRNNDGAFSKGSVLIISETEPLSLSVSQSPSYAVTSSISSRPSFSEESKLRSQQTHVLSKRMLLHTAAAGGHIERIKGLLVAGYDINASCDDGMKAISWACRRGHWDACRLLVESKATANFKDSSGSSALHYVCRYRRLVAIGEGEGEEEEDRKNTNVVSKNTTANKTEEAKRTRTPKRNGDAKDGVSQRAAYDATLEHRRMVKLLVDAGARVNGADENGRTALHYATENDYTGVVDALLIQKAALNLPDRHNSTALHLACAVKRERTDEIVLLLLREMEHALPSAIDMQDKGGHTPFQYAFTNSLDVVAVELVRRGADPRVPAFLTCGDTKRQQALLEIAAASIENMLHLKRGVRPHPLPIKLPPSCSSQRAPNSSRPPCASKKKFGYFTTRSNCKSCGYVYCPECVVKIDTTLV
jgi:ankyrin repeat protein